MLLIWRRQKTTILTKNQNIRTIPDPHLRRLPIQKLLWVSSPWFLKSFEQLPAACSSYPRLTSVIIAIFFVYPFLFADSLFLFSFLFFERRNIFLFFLALVIVCLFDIFCWSVISSFPAFLKFPVCDTLLLLTLSFYLKLHFAKFVLSHKGFFLSLFGIFMLVKYFTIFW